MKLTADTITDEPKLPSIAQMAARSLDVHRKLLVSVRDSALVVTPQHGAGDIRGFQTAMRTLFRWKCVSSGELTERGLALLEILNARAEGLL